MKDILNKCYYYTNSYDDIINFWQKNLDAEIVELNQNTSMMHLNENSIRLIEKADKIPVDCRIFALLYSKIQKEGCAIILQKSEQGIEIDTEGCFYLSLSNKINLTEIGKDVKKKIELKSCLLDNQGQWLAKEDNNYVGICSDGILKMSLNKWFEYWSTIVNNTLDSYIMGSKENLFRDATIGILKINIKEYGLILSLYKYGLLGNVIELEEFKHDKNKKIVNKKNY